MPLGGNRPKTGHWGTKVYLLADSGSPYARCQASGANTRDRAGAARSRPITIRYRSIAKGRQWAPLRRSVVTDCLLLLRSLSNRPCRLRAPSYPCGRCRQPPYLALQYNPKEGRAVKRGQFNREEVTFRYARSSGSEDPSLRKKDLRS